MKTLFPYRTLTTDVSMLVHHVALDARPLPSAFIDSDRLEVVLSSIGASDWETARIDVSVTASFAELSEPAGEWKHPLAVLVANCGYTNSRSSSTLEVDPTTPGRWTGSIELERDEWFGRGTIRAAIMAEVDRVEHRMIGIAPSWNATLDDLPSTTLQSSIIVQWMDFNEPTDGAVYLREYRAEPWYLSLDERQPILFLNSSFDGLEALMVDRRGRPRAERALHDSLRANIASEVWAAMFMAALDEIETDEDTGTPDWPDEPWQRGVLETLLVRMYPDATSREDALMMVSEARTDRDGARIQERLLPAASAQAQVPRLLRNGISLLEMDDDAREEGTAR